MQNTIKAKIAQITLAIAMTFGGAVSAQAASLDQVVFGQSSEETMAQSATLKPANMSCLKDNQFMMSDTKVDAFLNTEIDVVKYAFAYNQLYNIEVNFKKSNIDAYNKLMKRMTDKYGKGKENVSYNKETGDAEICCTWQMDGKIMQLSFMKNEEFKFDNLFLLILAERPGVNAVSK